MQVIDIKSTGNKIKGNSKYKEVQLLLDNGRWVGCEAIIIDLGIFNRITATTHGNIQKLLDIATDIYNRHIRSKILNISEPIYSITCYGDLLNIEIEDYIVRQNNTPRLVVKDYVSKIVLGELETCRADKAGKDNLIFFDEIVLPDGITLEIGWERDIWVSDVDLKVSSKKITNLEGIGEVLGNLGLLRKLGADIPKKLTFRNIKAITLIDYGLEELKLESNCNLEVFRVYDSLNLRKIELPQLNLDPSLLYIANISPECVIYTPSIPIKLRECLMYTVDSKPIKVVELLR